MHRRSATVVLGLTAALATALTGCSSSTNGSSWSSNEAGASDDTVAAALDNDQLVGVCVDPVTKNRLPDDQCDKCAGLTDNDERPEECRDNRRRHHGSGAWFYAPLGYMIGRHGAKVDTSKLQSSVPPGRAFTNGGVAAAGGAVAKPGGSAVGRTGSSIVRGGFGGSARGSSGG